MRIAFVTQWFPPEAGAFVAAAIADGLADRGHVVDVLTGFPNYPSGVFHADYPLARYRRDQRSELVTVHRAPLYPSHDANSVKRMANYLSFGVCASWVARTRLTRPDVWLTYSSPATAALPALTVPRSLRAPSFLIIQDLWPDSVTESGFVRGVAGRGIERVLHSYCNHTYRKAVGIGVISPSMRRILIERGAAPGSIHLTPNWVEDGHLMPDHVASDDARQSLGLPPGRLFMYAGNMGELQFLAPLVKAFGLCPEVNLALVGDGVARAGLETLVRRQNMRNVHFVESQPADRIGHFLAASDVQVISLKDTPLLRATMPSKVQTSMAASRPILLHAAGDAADLVTLSGSGIAVRPGDVANAVDTIRVLDGLGSASLRAMGRNGRDYYEKHFCPTAGLDRMEKMLMTRVDVEEKNLWHLTR